VFQHVEYPVSRDRCYDVLERVTAGNPSDFENLRVQKLDLRLKEDISVSQIQLGN
jgi:hypothetical protein